MAENYIDKSDYHTPTRFAGDTQIDLNMAGEHLDSFEIGRARLAAAEASKPIEVEPIPAQKVAAEWTKKLTVSRAYAEEHGLYVESKAA